MKKIKFSKSWLIGIVSGLLIVAILGTVAAVFARKSAVAEEEISRDLIDAIVAGQTGLGRYASASGTLDYDYGGDTLDMLEDNQRGFSTNGVEVEGVGDWVKLKLDGKNEILNYGKSEYGSSSITFLAPIDENGEYPTLADGKHKFIFETDFKWSIENDVIEEWNKDPLYYLRIAFVDESGKRFAPVYGTKSVGSDRMYFSDSGTALKGRCILEADEWHNLRLEYFYSPSADLYYVRLFLDNISKEWCITSDAVSSMSGVNVSLRQYVTDLNLYFDNTYVGCVPK